MGKTKLAVTFETVVGCFCVKIFKYYVLVQIQSKSSF